jgi:hypothetical protein
MLEELSEFSKLFKQLSQKLYMYGIINRNMRTIIKLMQIKGALEDKARR